MDLLRWAPQVKSWCPNLELVPQGRCWGLRLISVLFVDNTITARLEISVVGQLSEDMPSGLSLTDIA